MRDRPPSDHSSRGTRLDSSIDAPPPTPSIGILLANVGSPEAPTPAALRRYLAEFLGDPRIVELPRWLWLPILHGIVLQTRPRRSAALYRRIWTEHGSPLLTICRSQAEGISRALEARLGHRPQVAIGMRYGQPSIGRALRQLAQAGADRLLIFPLYPQYSATTTASALDAAFGELGHWRNIPEVRTIRDYHQHPGYLAAVALSVQEHWETSGRPDRLLISFHGIPEGYVRSGDPYPDQCRITARHIAERLELSDAEWGISFQSRLGPVRWLTPYTDELLMEWARAGVRRVQVLAPGFSADCLETLDELDREAREAFLQAGGEPFAYIPALNVRPDLLACLSQIVLANLQGWIPTAATS